MATDPITAEPPPTAAAAAYAELARRLRPELVLVAAAVLLDRSEAEDVAQDALATGLRDQEQLGAMARPDLWLRRVTVNRALDLRRRRQRFGGVFGRLSSNATLRAELGDTVAFWDAVGGLSRRQQEVVVLRATGELSVEEIAETLEIAPGTVKATLHAARGKLAHLVEGADG